MSDLVTIVATLTPAEGKADAVRKHLLELAKQTEAHEKGTLRYEVTESDGGKEFVVIEDYQDKSAHEAHRNSEHFGKLLKTVQSEGLLAKQLEVKVLKKVGGFSKN